MKQLHQSPVRNAHTVWDERKTMCKTVPLTTEGARSMLTILDDTNYPSQDFSRYIMIQFEHAVIKYKNVSGNVHSDVMVSLEVVPSQNGITSRDVSSSHTITCPETSRNCFECYHSKNPHLFGL